MKFKTIATLALSAFLLAACTNQPEHPTEESLKETEQQAKEQANAEQTAKDNHVIDDNGNLITPNTIETHNAVYAIEDIRLGEKDLDGAPVAIVEMEFTNKQKHPVSPWVSFVLDFDVTQNEDGDPEKLDGPNTQLSNEDHGVVEMGDTDVDPEDSVHAIISYHHKDKDKPVFFRSRKDPNISDFFFNKD